MMVHGGIGVTVPQDNLYHPLKPRPWKIRVFFRDDSALNALELRCSDGRVLKSAEGSKGTWSTPISVPKGLKEVTMRDGSEGGHGAASIKFKDCTGTEIKPGEQFDDTWGEYLDWKSCPENTVIAGFRSKVFDGSFFRGSSGVNKIEFHCSQLDEISHCNGNGELWTIAADFISKVQNGQFESRKIKFEAFASLSPAIKKIVILELNVDEAEEIVNNAPAFDFDQVLTESIIEKLSSKCNQACKKVKQDALSKVHEVEKKIENQEIEEKKRINGLEIATKGFTIISKFATDFDLQTFTPEVQRQTYRENRRGTQSRPFNRRPVK